MASAQNAPDRRNKATTTVQGSGAGNLSEEEVAELSGLLEKDDVSASYYSGAVRDNKLRNLLMHARGRAARAPEGVVSSGGNKRGIDEASKASVSSERNGWGTLNDPRVLIQQLPEKHALLVYSKPEKERAELVHRFFNDVSLSLTTLQQHAVSSQPSDMQKVQKIVEYLKAQNKTLDMFEFRV